MASPPMRSQKSFLIEMLEFSTTNTPKLSIPALNFIDTSGDVQKLSYALTLSVNPDLHTLDSV